MAEFFSMKACGSPECTLFTLQVGFEASNSTHVPLRPSCADLWLKPHPFSSIVTVLGQWLPLQSKKRPAQCRPRAFYS